MQKNLFFCSVLPYTLPMEKTDAALFIQNQKLELLNRRKEQAFEVRKRRREWGNFDAKILLDLYKVENKFSIQAIRMHENLEREKQELYS